MDASASSLDPARIVCIVPVPFSGGGSSSVEYDVYSLHEGGATSTTSTTSPPDEDTTKAAAPSFDLSRARVPSADLAAHPSAALLKGLALTRRPEHLSAAPERRRPGRGT